MRAPRRARRLLEQQRQERALGLPQRESPRQREPQPGLSLVPELDGSRAVDAARGMDQTAHPAAYGLRCSGELQGAQGAGRRSGAIAASNAPWAADSRGNNVTI